MGELCQEIDWLACDLNIFGEVVVRVHPMDTFDKAISRHSALRELTHIEPKDSIMATCVLLVGCHC